MVGSLLDQALGRTHVTESSSRSQRDLQTLTGRRGAQDDRAVLWKDFDNVVTELAARFQASNGDLISAFGGVPSSEVARRITSTIEYVDAEAAIAIAEANTLFDTARAESEALFDTARAEAAQLVIDLGTRFDQQIPRISTAESQIDDFALALSHLASQIQRTDQRVADAGIYIDPDEGTVRIAGFEQVDNRISTAEIRVDAVEAEVVTRVTQAELNSAISNAVLDPSQIPVLDDFELRLGDVEVEVSAATASITEKAALTLVNGIDVRLQTAESSVDALNAQIALKAASSDLTAVDSRLSGAEVVIDALNVPAITQTVYDSRSQYDDLDQQAINSLEDLLDNYKDREAIREDMAFARSEIAAVVNEEREALAAARLELGASIASNLAALAVEEQARADADSALSAIVTTLTATTGENAAAIESEQLARVDDVSSLAADLSSLTATVGGNTTAITDEAGARADADSAIAGTVTSLTSSFNTLESGLSSAEQDIAANTASLTQESLARANADEAITSTINSLSSTVGANSSAISQEVGARAEADSALSAFIDTLTATVDLNTSAITDEQVARTNADQALTTSINTLTTNFNGVNSSLTTQATAISTLESYAASTYTIRAVAGAAEALLEVVAADDPVNGAVSAFRFTADAVLFDASIQAKHLAVDSITAEKIDVDSLDAISATIGTLKSAETGERVEIEDDRIRVFDANNVLRVVIGRLT